MRPTRLVLTVIALAFLGACTTTSPVHDDVIDNRPTYPDAVGLLNSMASEIPADVDGVGVIDMRRLHDYHMVTAFGLLEKEWDAAPMHSEMQAVYRERLGVDISQADAAFLAFQDEDIYVFLIGKIDGPAGAGVARGALTVWTPPGEPGVRFVRKKGVDALIVTMEGGVEKLVAGPRLAGTERLAVLQRLLERVGDGDVVIAGRSDKVEDPMPSMPIPGTGMPNEIPKEVAGGAVSISDRFVLAIQGDPAELTALRDKMNTAIDEWRATLRETDEPVHADTDAQVGALGYAQEPARESTMGRIGVIWAYHFLGALQNEVQPSLEGDMIVWDVRTEFFTHPVMIGVAVGGIVYVIYTAFVGGLGNALGGPSTLGGPAAVPGGVPTAPGVGPGSVPAGPTGP